MYKDSEEQKSFWVTEPEAKRKAENAFLYGLSMGMALASVVWVTVFITLFI